VKRQEWLNTKGTVEQMMENSTVMKDLQNQVQKLGVECGLTEPARKGFVLADLKKGVQERIENAT